MEDNIRELNTQVVDDDQMVLGDVDDFDDEEYSSDAIVELCKLPTRISHALNTRKDIEAIKAMVDNGEYSRLIEMIENDDKLTSQQKAESITKILDHRTESYRKGGEINNHQRESKGKTVVVVISAIGSVLVAIGEWINWRRRR